MKNRLLKKGEMAQRLGLSVRSLNGDKKRHDILLAYGMFDLNKGGGRPSWRMREQDFELVIEAMARGQLRPIRGQHSEE